MVEVFMEEAFTAAIFATKILLADENFVVTDSGSVVFSVVIIPATMDIELAI